VAGHDGARAGRGRRGAEREPRPDRGPVAGRPTFTTNAIATNQFHFDVTGGTDPGAGFVGTGPHGPFKVPSLLFLNADRPWMHHGALGTLAQVVRFYDASLRLGLTPAR
jgi:cytochrome c peroxidase